MSIETIGLLIWFVFLYVVWKTDKRNVTKFHKWKVTKSNKKKNTN